MSQTCQTQFSTQYPKTWLDFSFSNILNSDDIDWIHISIDMSRMARMLTKQLLRYWSHRWGNFLACLNTASFVKKRKIYIPINEFIGEESRIEISITLECNLFLFCFRLRVNDLIYFENIGFVFFFDLVSVWKVRKFCWPFVDRSFRFINELHPRLRSWNEWAFSHQLVDSRRSARHVPVLHLQWGIKSVRSVDTDVSSQTNKVNNTTTCE